MNTENIYLDGHIDVPTERLADVTAALPAHVALTRAEAGCLSFNVTPCATVPGRFLVSEVFSDRTAFDVHQERTRNSDWFAVTAGIPRDYTIRSGDASA